MKKLNSSEQQEILVDDPLYTEYCIEDDDDELLKSIMRAGTIDLYCSNCESLSVFRVKPEEKHAFSRSDSVYQTYGLITVTATCTRRNIYDTFEKCENNFYTVFRHDGDVLVKIGQYPSKADLEFPVLDEAFDELPQKYRRELGTAIGLYSHGIGIGAFVYLRRIFESLVNEAKDFAKESPEWNEDVYKKLRMNEKIKLLDAFLPSRLVQSAHLYAFLSKGIHELDEVECREKFPLVKQAIYLILKEKKENRDYRYLMTKINR